MRQGAIRPHPKSARQTVSRPFFILEWSVLGAVDVPVRVGIIHNNRLGG